MRKLLIILGLILVQNGIIQAQEKMLLLNGRTIDIKRHTLNDDYIFYYKTNDLRTKARLTEKIDVFSI